MTDTNQYAERDPMELDRDGNYYCRHVSAMTAEGLHKKSDIAAELAWRDREIDRLTALSARASAGEGAIPKREIADFFLDKLVQIGTFAFASRQLRRDFRAAAECMKPVYTAPQPAQAGASGGGDVPDDVAERCRTYDSARLLQCALEVYARSCMYNTEAQHNAAMAYRDELLRRLTPASVEPREAFAWMKAGPSGTPLLHTVTQNIKIREEWEANGWVSIPIFLPTPPAHGDGEVWIDRTDLAGIQSGRRCKAVVFAEAFDGDCIPLTTRPTPEAQEARDAALEREQGVREDAQRQLRAAERAREEVELGHRRYELLRTMNAQQFTELFRRNVAGENFDAMIDAFLAASGGK